ncbi:hypothetical protein ACHAXN_010502 [Cyclotella atomus]
MGRLYNRNHFSTCVLHIVMALLAKSINAASSTAAPSSSISYTTGITEEKCVLEEEFHGLSSEIRLEGHHEEHAWWDDDETDDYNVDSSSAEDRPQQNDKKFRWRAWKNKSDLRSESSRQKSNAHAAPITPLAEHPMRTDEWEFDIQLSPLFQNEDDLFPESSLGSQGHTKRSRYKRRQVMQFARNGYVKVLQDEHFTSNNVDASFISTAPNADKPKRSQVQVGKWKIGHGGVAFDVQVNVCRRGNAQEMAVLHYHADIHLNKFGERPRMFRGIITRDRYNSSVLPPNFLRPVIGTFSAQGIGHDTADTSYKERGFGLSRQQITQKQS